MIKRLRVEDVRLVVAVQVSNIKVCTVIELVCGVCVGGVPVVAVALQVQVYAHRVVVPDSQHVREPVAVHIRCNRPARAVETRADGVRDPHIASAVVILSPLQPCGATFRDDHVLVAVSVCKQAT